MPLPAAFLTRPIAHRALHDRAAGRPENSIEAIRAAGLEPGEDIRIITVDAVRAGMEALAEGDINFIVECNPLLGEQLMELVEQVAAGEQAEERALPAAGGPDDGDELTRSDREVDALQDGQRATAGGQGLGERAALDDVGRSHMGRFARFPTLDAREVA